MLALERGPLPALPVVGTACVPDRLPGAGGALANRPRTKDARAAVGDQWAGLASLDLELVLADREANGTDYAVLVVLVVEQLGNEDTIPECAQCPLPSWPPWRRSTSSSMASGLSNSPVMMHDLKDFCS